MTSPAHDSPPSRTPESDSDTPARSPTRTLAALGWTGLASWAAVGLALEAAHGFKLASYLDDELTRLLATLAHAHGSLLSLVLVVFAANAEPSARDGWPRPALVAAWLLMPLGFLASTIAHPESDPGLAIGLVPIGGLFLVASLAATARAAWRA